MTKSHTLNRRRRRRFRERISQRMSRICSTSLRTGRVRIEETVSGDGDTVQDAIQSALDNMERRCTQMRLELLKMRGERP